MASSSLHPVLRNPLKYLKRTPKAHAPDLYIKGSYDSQSLSTNPFAAMLLDTRMDVSRTRFPLGSSIQTIVEKSGESHQLKPVLVKPTQGQNPASYVANSGPYIRFLEKKFFFPLPMKYRLRGLASFVARIKCPPDFGGLVRELYTQEIGRLLPLAVTTPITKVKPLDQGLVLRKDSDGMRWVDGRLVVTSTLAPEDEVFLPFGPNRDLTLMLIKLAEFSAV